MMRREELDEATVWLLGNSMGGQLALDLALRAPDRVAGLILLAPDVGGAPESRRWPSATPNARHDGSSPTSKSSGTS
jgi:pimeloyl-ACP methyl ester carboxylesterase